MNNTYSVICILHGNVVENGKFIPDETEALRQAKAFLARGARCVEIYDTNDDLVWIEGRESAAWIRDQLSDPTDINRASREGRDI